MGASQALPHPHPNPPLEWEGEMPCLTHEAANLFICAVPPAPTFAPMSGLERLRQPDQIGHRLVQHAPLRGVGQAAVGGKGLVGAAQRHLRR